jgi:hypothetical protein
LFLPLFFQPEVIQFGCYFCIAFIESFIKGKLGYDEQKERFKLHIAKMLFMTDAPFSGFIGLLNYLLLHLAGVFFKCYICQKLIISKAILSIRITSKARILKYNS